jgi:hypothetical protein
MTPPAHRHDALRSQPVAGWQGLRRAVDQLQGAARPRFLSSVLVLATASWGLALALQQLLAWLPPWPAP